MVLSFKKRFVPAVKDGTKPHTLRSGDRWKVGTPIQFYENARQRNMAKIRPDGVCHNAQKAEIKRHDGLPSLFIQGRCLTPLEAQELAVRDGFQDFAELLKFIDETHGLPWKGQLVGWTKLHY